MINTKYDFGIVKTLRGKFKLTLEKLAEKSGLTYTTVENIETNKTMPSLKTLDALASALEVSVSDFMALSEKKLVQKRNAEILNDISGEKPNLILNPIIKMACFDKAKVLIVTATAGQSVRVPELHDDCFEMCVVSSGTVELRFDSQVQQLKTDNVVLFDGTMPHSYLQIEDGQFTTIHIPKKSNVIKMLLQDQNG